jgi:hypothetical protein
METATITMLSEEQLFELRQQIALNPESNLALLIKFIERIREGSEELAELASRDPKFQHLCHLQRTVDEIVSMEIRLITARRSPSARW